MLSRAKGYLGARCTRRYWLLVTRYWGGTLFGVQVSGFRILPLKAFTSFAADDVDLINSAYDEYLSLHMEYSLIN